MEEMKHENSKQQQHSAHHQINKHKADKDVERSQMHHNHVAHNHGGIAHHNHSKHIAHKEVHPEKHQHHGKKDDSEHTSHGEHHNHHEMMIKDFKKRFFVSLILTVPVLFLSPLIQSLLGLGEVFRFRGSDYVQFLLASVIFFYGGQPFLKGFYSELKNNLRMRQK